MKMKPRRVERKHLDKKYKKLGWSRGRAKAKNGRYTKFLGRAAVMGLCLSMTAMSPMRILAETGAGLSWPDTGLLATGRNEADFGAATRSNAVDFNVAAQSNAVGFDAATQSNAVDFDVATQSNGIQGFGLRSVSTGDLWKNWVGDLSFLNGERGDGTEEEPYQISTKAHLMGLSELAARSMVIGEDEGDWPGDYTGAHFILTRNIDLGGMEWMPIGFYRDEADFFSGEVSPFEGYMHGNGKTVSNFRIYQPDWNMAGLFGAVKDSVIEDITVKPGYVLTANENAGILAGSVSDSEIRNVSVSGSLKTQGTVGGIAAAVSEGTIIENCMADHVSMDSGEERETFVGGIAGTAAESFIIDCTVNAGSSLNARIQGNGHVGGIVGFQNDTDIYNVHVMGTIGGAGSQAIGGVTGKYASGKMKVARFEGIIASSGMGSLAREGTFIGTHDTGFHFRFGTEAGADLAYLFADSEEKIAAGICGSGIPDDNAFTYEAYIGFWHDQDNFFTLVQGQNTRKETEQYFYEKLEEGVLHLIDTEDAVQGMLCTPDHFAPNSVGRPTRGYLVSVLQIDTAANVENYYDVATLTARGESAYSKELNKVQRGAVAAGDVVTVMTAPKNTESEKYQMDGVPTYTDETGDRVDMAYQTGGSYSFVMPEHDTEISAVYKKVAAEIRVVPEEFEFRVTQERSGDRKNPSIVTEVRDGAGKLLARYVNGALEKGTEVQDVTFHAVVDKNNDVADSRVAWSVDDGNLLILKRNPDEDSEGYTQLSASVELNLQADFFRDIMEAAEQEQRNQGYRYPIADTIYGNGTQGGLAVLTAKTRDAASFEGKPVMANCRIPVTFQIKDRTKTPVDTVQLSQENLKFTVTRVLTGNRRAPKEEWKVSAPQNVTATFVPENFDKRSVTWEISDPYVVQIDAGNYQYGGENTSDYKLASVRVVEPAKWMQDITAADDAAYEADRTVKREGKGIREAVLTVLAEDVLGNKETAACKVTVEFKTDDQTYYRSSGGSSGGSGGSSGSSGGSSGKSSGSASTITASTAIPAGVVTGGNWIFSGDGMWMYEHEGKRFANQWAYIFNPYATGEQETVSWFRFDENGKMMTGWYQDPSDGCWYYLHPVSDGSQGYMYTGHQVIDDVSYFFDSDGRMVTA